LFWKLCEAHKSYFVGKIQTSHAVHRVAAVFLKKEAGHVARMEEKRNA
jgi:hypothetical protein